MQKNFKLRTWGIIAIVAGMAVFGYRIVDFAPWGGESFRFELANHVIRPMMAVAFGLLALGVMLYIESRRPQ